MAWSGSKDMACSSDCGSPSTSCRSATSCDSSDYRIGYAVKHCGLDWRRSSRMKRRQTQETCSELHSGNGERSGKCRQLAEEFHCHSSSCKRFQKSVASLGHVCTVNIDAQEECCHSSFPPCLYRMRLSHESGSECCHNKLPLKQEQDELTRAYCDQRMCSPANKHHHHCPHDHSHFHDRICHSCKHFSRLARPCHRSDMFRPTSNRVADMNARREKQQTFMEGHGLFKGEIQPTTDKGMEHRDRDIHLDSQEGNWLTLKIAPPELTVPDFDMNGTNLGLPGCCSQGPVKATEGFDMNLIGGQDKKSLSGVGSRFVDHGFLKPRRESEIIVLDDSDDDCVNRNMDASLGDLLVHEEKGGVSLSTVQKTVMDDCSSLVKDVEGSARWKDTNIVHANVAEESAPWKDSDVHSPCMQGGMYEQSNTKEIGEPLDLKERSEASDIKGRGEPSHVEEMSENWQSESSKPIGGSSQITMEKEASLTEAAVKVIQIQGLLCHEFKPRKKRMIDKKSLRMLRLEELDDIDAPVGKATTVDPLDAPDSKTTTALMSNRKESEIIATRVTEESTLGKDINVHNAGMQGGMYERADLKERFEPLDLKERGEPSDIRKTSECWQSECRKHISSSSRISTNKEASLTEAAVRVKEIQRLSCQGFKPRKKRMLDKKSLPVLSPEELDDVGAFHATADKPTAIDPFDATDGKAVAIVPSDAANCKTTTVLKALLSKSVEAKPRMWEEDLLCDLCQKGPSLSMGEWYAWCCGLRLHGCGCSPAVKLKVKLFMLVRKSNKPKKNDDCVFSGTVHKMCALWSSEVYEEGERLEGLSDAVKRGRSLICAACREYGATLGCRVKACRRSFHYPCADELANKLHCRMWDGVHVPVACRGHRYVNECCTNAKERNSNLMKWRFRGFVARIKEGSAVNTSLEHAQGSLASSSMKAHQMKGGAMVSPTQKLSQPLDQHKYRDPCTVVIDISTDSEDENKKEVVTSGTSGIMQGLGNSAPMGSAISVEPSFKENSVDKQDNGQSRLLDAPGALYHMGSKLLCQDISRGHEAVLVPCTNDVDSDPAPIVNYIIENRYLGRAKRILDSLLLDTTCAARPCKGCNINAIDNPHVEASLHTDLRDGQREHDTRFDWQGQSMLGCLPYDKFGRLLLGPDNKDIVECNSKCPCGPHCSNNELQKGLTVPLEVFKTLNRGWGVRSMEQIPRGQFVVEYIGEVITHDEADVRGLEYDQLHLSCLFNADHPDISDQDVLVIDGFRMSNVARFINHSCDGNLSVYRVYTETLDLRFCRIGLFALRDIEIGEELSYDYGYATCKDTKTSDMSTDPTVIRCLCGAKKCRQWLWTGNSR